MLLSVSPNSGRITTKLKINYGLMGVELVQLAAIGRVDIEAGRVVVRSAAATGDPRLDAIAMSAGKIDLPQTAFGGLAYAIGLANTLYRGWGNREIRKRFREIADGQWTKPPSADVDVPDAPDTAAAASTGADAAHAAGQAAIHAASQAATHAAAQAATHAAVHAATHAATHAAVHAAVHASVDAGHSAAASGGHAGH